MIAGRLASQELTSQSSTDMQVSSPTTPPAQILAAQSQPPSRASSIPANRLLPSHASNPDQPSLVPTLAPRPPPMPALTPTYPVIPAQSSGESQVLSPMHSLPPHSGPFSRASIPTDRPSPSHALAPPALASPNTRSMTDAPALTLDELRNDISASLPQSRAMTSPRQRAHETAIRKAVEEEKARLKKSPDRNHHLAEVRRLFLQLYDAPEDEDFIANHVPAPQDAVNLYLEGKGPGPDQYQFRFTKAAPFNNPWNRAIAVHLAGVLWHRQQTERWYLKTGREVQTVSEAYWEDAVLDKFKRIRVRWMNTEPRIVEDPRTGEHRQESRDEADERRFNEGEALNAVGRRRERRNKVTCHTYITSYVNAY